MTMNYAYRHCGTCGCELLNGNGAVFCWTISGGWAAFLTDMLNAIANARAAVSG